MDIAITKMSTKGQIVIPLDMREDFEIGEKLLVIKSDDKLIIKKAADMDKQFKEDLEFARRTEAAWKRYDEGKFKSMSEKEFLKMLKKC